MAVGDWRILIVDALDVELNRQDVHLPARQRPPLLDMPPWPP